MASGGVRVACAAASASLVLLFAVAYRHRRRRDGALLAQAPLLARPPPQSAGQPAVRRSGSCWGVMRARRRLVLLSNLRDMAGTLGLDIGGTMAKMVLAVAGESEHHVVLGGGFREHARLSFSVELDPASSSRLTLQFVSTSIDRLAEAVRLLRSRVPQVSSTVSQQPSSRRQHDGASVPRTGGSGSAADCDGRRRGAQVRPAIRGDARREAGALQGVGGVSRG